VPTYTLKADGSTFDRGDLCRTCCDDWQSRRQLNAFVKDVRDARHDLDSVKMELSSLQTVLEVIAEDASNEEVTFPPLLTKQLPGIVETVRW
jgi:hypothetical protein